MSERETALKAVRLKAIKLLEALAERCERPEDEDHDWHPCRSCVAAFSLTQPGEKSLLRLLLDELMAAGADPVPVCQWREIATAPKDGTHIFGMVKGERRIIAWGRSSHTKWLGWCLADQGVEDFDICEPTLWHPFPA